MTSCNAPQVWYEDRSRCINFQPCPSGKIWDLYENKCVHRSRTNNHVKNLVNLEAEYWKNEEKAQRYKLWERRQTITELEDRLYPNKWDNNPGNEGFNAYVTGIFHHNDIFAKDEAIACPSSDGTKEDQAYQKTLTWMFHPKSPMTRLGVIHRTGSGKTLSMIRCLENFIDDPRPKLAIFPNDEVRDNFYAELMAWPNAYRDYVLTKIKTINMSEATNRKLSKHQLEQCVDILALKNNLSNAGQNSFMAAPLRAFSYREMGGKSSDKLGFLQKNHNSFVLCPSINNRPNLMCNKVVVMDEAHNLIKPDTDKITNPISIANLKHLKISLTVAKNTAVALFTATPIQDDPSEADELLQVIKGVGNSELNDEGFLSAYYSSPESAYAKSNPGDREIPKIVTVELTGDPKSKTTSLGNYLSKLLKGPNSNYEIDNKFIASSTRDIYEYTSAYTNSQSSVDFLKRLKHEPQIVAPKLYQCAKMIQAAQGKVIVLTRRRHGFFSLGQLIETCPEFADLAGGRVQSLLGSADTSRKDYRVFECDGRARQGADLTECVKKNFNEAANSVGQHIKCLILNADEFSEGIDFKAVRTIVLLDVPSTWGSSLQRVGRAIRHCAAEQLPKHQRTVDTFVLVATLPSYALMGKKAVDLKHILTVDEKLLINLINSRQKIEARMCKLINSATDRQILGPIVGADYCGRPNPPALSEDERSAMRENAEEGMNSCSKKMGTCLRTGTVHVKKAFPNDDGTQYARMLQICSQSRDRCVNDVMVSMPVDPNFINCPPSYGAEQCDTYCSSYNLTDDEKQLCKQRRNNIPRFMACGNNDDVDECNQHCLDQGLSDDDLEQCKLSQNSSAGSRVTYGPDLPVCVNCPEQLKGAECVNFCKHQGLKNQDLYKCISKNNQGPCTEMPGASPVTPQYVESEINLKSRRPAGNDDSDYVVYNDLGQDIKGHSRNIKRGGKAHRDGCDDDPPLFDDCTGVKPVKRRNTPAKRK